MRLVTIASLAPLALLVSAGAHAASGSSQLRPLCAADLPAQCQALAIVPPSATTPQQEFSTRISVANCMAEDALGKLSLRPSDRSLDRLHQAAQPSLTMLDDVIAHGDAHNREVAQAAKADLLNGMAVRIRRVTNDPMDKHGLEARLVSWQREANRTLAMGQTCGETCPAG
jgi:hypothetical protein